MASIFPEYNYDIFISYRQKDNKGDRWISEFVDALKDELESTFKEEISVYFDINPHDGLLETHDVAESLKEKLKCLVFIPIISRTYCDPKSFAWEHEFIAFINQASEDHFGLKVKLAGGNIANRVLPVRIHDLDNDDLKLCESVLGGVLRGVEFIYKSPGVNRSLRSKEDNPADNLNKTYYRDQINKVALAIKDIIQGMKTPVADGQVTDKGIKSDIEEQPERDITPGIKKHNLPISTTSFIGRKKEIKEVRDLFNKSRLVTLIGSGGCGKTRLTREIASMLVEEYKDGVWFIDLALVTDPNFVTKEISQVLNIKEEPNKEIIDTLIGNIKDKSLLLLLDNCEHLVQTCAEIAHKLLNTVKGIRILATSREALNIPGEVVWRIPSLSFPDLKKDINEVKGYEAIELFIDRAGSSKPGFTLNPQNVSSVIGICQRIDGIPLGIELAAARIRHMGTESILERLDDQFKILSSSSRIAPERQQTLEATINWSYNLLSKQEQLIFSRLSVFTGYFNLEAVEEVCSDDTLKKEDILLVLFQLVDKSLIIAETQEDESVRYRCLEQLRQYGLQRLRESGKEEKQRKLHLSYFLKLAEEAYEDRLESQLKWLNRLGQEHDNLLAALNWSEAKSNKEFVSLSGTLAWFWVRHSHLLTGRKYLDKSLSKALGKTEANARVLFGLGMIDEYSGDFPSAIKHMNESLNIWRQLKNRQEEAIVLRELTWPYTSVGDNETGMKCTEQSLEIAREIGNPGLINHCLTSVCMILVFSKKYGQARPLVEELLVSSKKLEQAEGIINAHHFLGDCYLGDGNFPEAEKAYGLSIEIALGFRDIYQACFDLQGVAMSIASQSRWAKSIRLDAAACEKVRILGTTLSGVAQFWDEWVDTYIRGAREKLGEELTRKYEEEGINMGFEAAVEYALDFDKD